MVSNTRAMIALVATVYLVLAGPITVTSFAAVTPITQADCEKAGMRWKAKAGKCKRMSGQPLSSAERAAAVIGIISAIAALVLLFEDWIRRLIGVKATGDDAR